MDNDEIIGLKATPDQITQAAARVWQVNPDEIFSKCRKRYIIEPRQIVLFHMVKVLDISAEKIADDTSFSKQAVYSAVAVMNAERIKANRVLSARYNLFLIVLQKLENGSKRV